MSQQVLRVAGVPIPPNKHIVIGLRAIYGIGPTRSKKICEAANIPFDKKAKDISPDEEEAIRAQVRVYQEAQEVEGDLRRKIAMAIKRLRDLKCYRGLRHLRGLPVRGQRTHTNAKTRKRRRGRTTGPPSGNADKGKGKK